MLLTDKINRCTSAIQRKRVAQENKQSTEAYVSAITQLNATCENLKATIRCASAMKDKGVVTYPLIMEQMREDLLECANNCGQGLYDGTLTTDTVKILKAKSDSFAGQIVVVWKDASSKYAEGIQGYLSLIGGLSSEPKKASNLYDRIGKIVDGRPSVDAIDSLIEYVAQAKAIIDGFALNEHIELFLKKVSNREATVLDLNQEVLDWLRDKHLSGKLKIGF